MRRLSLLLVSCLLAGGFSPLPAAAAAVPEIVIVAGVTDEGRATPQWEAMVRQRGGDPAFAAVAGLRKPYTVDELAWVRTIQARRQAWIGEAARLAAMFPPLPAPAARIVLGNRGGEDAFVHDPHTIGFDVSRLQSLYGDGNGAAGAERMDRFFRHEYMHLLQKAWFARHPPAQETPLQRALAEILTEGMGNYFSLSGKWLPVGGGPSAATLSALRQLEPRFASRLAALACARPEAARLLSADLSAGRFDRKWGALPMALWIASDPRGPAQVLPQLLRAGPEGVWTFAAEHMAPENAHLLAEARDAAALCGAEARASGGP